ncbi:hypothetical protein HMPREF9999_01392 [Alloprevotella sp. oral taxon 473 str. F0040]|nr:hypothetical protein HMPREF9999_01392 [Alloprevotella sp. oral taxon 473 str. F0040]
MAFSVQVLTSSRLHTVEDSAQSYNISVKLHKLEEKKMQIQKLNTARNQLCHSFLSMKHEPFVELLS